MITLYICIIIIVFFLLQQLLLLYYEMLHAVIIVRRSVVCLVILEGNERHGAERGYICVRIIGGFVRALRGPHQRPVRRRKQTHKNV